MNDIENIIFKNGNVKEILLNAIIDLEYIENTSADGEMTPKEVSSMASLIIVEIKEALEELITPSELE